LLHGSLPPARIDCRSVTSLRYDAAHRPRNRNRKASGADRGAELLREAQGERNPHSIDVEEIVRGANPFSPRKRLECANASTLSPFRDRYVYLARSGKFPRAARPAPGCDD